MKNNLNIELNIYNAELIDVKGLRFKYNRLQLIATYNISSIQEGTYILNKYYGISIKNARELIRSTLLDMTNRSSCIVRHKYGKDIRYVFETLVG